MFDAFSNIPEVNQYLMNVVRQVPFATASALTHTALGVREDVVKHMSEVFDRPTPFTLGAFMVVPAKKKDMGDMSAEVRTKPTLGKRHYLFVEKTGGVRPQTGIERLLDSGLPVPYIVRTAIPTRNAKRDKYGNWSVGQRNQVLSALRVNRDPRSNRRLDGMVRRGSSYVPGPDIFASTDDEGEGLTPGIYQRTPSGLVMLVRILDTSARYDPIFKFDQVALESSRRRFPLEISSALVRALVPTR